MASLRWRRTGAGVDQLPDGRVLFRGEGNAVCSHASGEEERPGGEKGGAETSSGVKGGVARGVRPSEHRIVLGGRRATQR